MSAAGIAPRAVAIVGAGNVGVAAAYALFVRRVATELILVDKDRARAEGEAMDLMHGQALVGRVTVRAGTFADLGSAQVVVITAGAAQRPGETRLDLLNRNAAIFRAIAKELDAHAPNAAVVVASNPVDVLTYAMQELSARPHARVVGTGTMLDTARFRALLGERYGVSPRSVHAYVLGEHGDSEVPVWSNATVGGIPLREQAVNGRPFDAAEMGALFEEVRRAAYRIIERKGYTNLAIGVVIASLVEAILGDQRVVWPVSVRPEGLYGVSGVALSVPAIIGRGGVEALVPPPLDAEELAGLRRSAQVLEGSLRGLDLSR